MSSSYGGYGHQSQYAPSAPQQPPYSSYYQTSTSNVPPPSNSSSSYNYANVSSSGSSSFPPGTPQDVITSFQMVDRDRSGFIDERELQQALSSGFHRFNLSTIRLLMFLFKNPHQPLAVGSLLTSLPIFFFYCFPFLGFSLFWYQLAIACAFSQDQRNLQHSGVALVNGEWVSFSFLLILFSFSR